MLNYLFKFCFILFVVFLFVGCGAKKAKPSPDKIVSIQIVDKNNITELISSEKRLKCYQNVDFLSPQSYNKVMRNYGEDENGQKKSYITSYYPSGQIKKYLELFSEQRVLICAPDTTRTYKSLCMKPMKDIVWVILHYTRLCLIIKLPKNWRNPRFHPV